VELLTIIIILGILGGLVAPAVTEARKRFKITQTTAIIEELTMGVDLYRDDLDELPPSDGSYPAPGETKTLAGAGGAAGLVQCLIGYLDTSHDGMSGPGFRRVRAGKAHGPYVSPDMKYAGDPPVFQDAFANSILYYRFDTASKTYDSGDNNTTDATGPTSLMTYVKDPHTTDQTHPYYLEDYLLLSPGPDRKWAEPTADTEKVDDIANFEFNVKETQQ